MIRRRARGQALVFALALLGSLVAAFLLAYESGRIVHSKMRLVNAADAAAFSAATWEARVLNFQSYMNRAVIANEVAIAQGTSLASWLDYSERTVERVDFITRYLPYLGQATTVLARILGATNEVAQPVLAASAAGLSAISHELALAAEGMHLAAAPATVDLVERVLARNDADAELTQRGRALLVAHGNQWLGFTRQYSGQRRARQQSVLFESRDRFTAQRTHDLGSGALSSVLRIPKRGGTDLLDYSTWRALDTIAVHARTPWSWQEASIGWGGAQRGRETRSRGHHGGTYRANRRTSRAAERDLREARGYLGLPGLRDIADPADRSPPVLALWIEAGIREGRAPNVQVDLGGATAVGAGREATLPAPPESARMSARAAAQVFFQRPLPRDDGRTELGSVYQPYWHARLAAGPLQGLIP